jgi:plasmid maintenance system antidote protein VapI
MSPYALIGQKSYNPGHLLDTLIEQMGIGNDAELSRALEVSRGSISRIRNQHQAISGVMLLRMHEISQISIRDLRYLMGDHRTRSWRNQI